MTRKNGSGNGNGEEGKILPITDKAKEKKDKSKKEKQIEKDLIAWALIELLSGNDPVSATYPLPDRLVVCRGPSGVPVLVAYDGQGVCRIVDKTFPTTLLMQYCSMPETKKFLEGMRPTKKWLDGIAEDWVAMQKGQSLDSIRMVLEKSAPGLCWHRLGYDLAPGETPTFDEMMSRMDNVTALKAFIGSLLDEESNRQQYVWIFGEGRNGKGSLLNFLSRTLGNSYRPESSHLAFADKFWNTKLIGTRLMAFEDCNTPKVVNDGTFKMLTGGVDKVAVEFKGKTDFLQKINTKFIFCSNERPAAQRSDANLRRAIYVESQRLPEGTVLLPTREYVGRLESEGAAFLWQCREAYLESKKTGHIESDQSRLIEAMEEAEERWELLFDEYFVEDKEGAVEASQFRSVLSGEDGPRLNDLEIGKFKRWMERTKNIKRYRPRESEKRITVYPGILFSEKSVQMGATNLPKCVF